MSLGDRTHTHLLPLPMCVFFKFRINASILIILFIYRMAFSAGSVRGHVRLAWCRSFYLTPLGDLRVRMWDDDDNEVGRG